MWLEDGSETSFEELVGRASEEGKKGVVVFTYPKASTPGCEWIFSFALFLVFWAILDGSYCFLHDLFRWVGSVDTCEVDVPYSGLSRPMLSVFMG